MGKKGREWGIVGKKGREWGIAEKKGREWGIVGKKGVRVGDSEIEVRALRYDKTYLNE